MDQIKFYKYTVGGLLFLNIAMLAFFLITKPKHEPRPPREDNNFQGEVVKILNLNSQQKNTFEALVKDHRLTMKTLNDQHQKLLSPYFESLTKSAEQINRDSMLILFQELERQKLEVTYQHFKEIKDLLNEEQLPYFQEFMKILIDRILGTENRNSPPPGNEHRNPPPPGNENRNPPPPRDR